MFFPHISFILQVIIIYTNPRRRVNVVYTKNVLQNTLKTKFLIYICSDWLDTTIIM